MNIFKKIKLALAVHNFWKLAEKEAKREVIIMNGDEKITKPGWKTTEFYLILVSNLLTIAGTLKGIIPADTSAIILASLNGIYGILRTIAKK